ncbi:MAG: translocation/assembly module TamB domain-containing protein [Acidobacteriota bacterium]|nr:translocation/assembly module TamB domain-containing protein [Acidobacteriota bacterium]
MLSRERARKILRYVGLALTIFAATLAAAIVSSLTIDLGPSLRHLAEREGSKRIERPIHIGRLSIRLARGRFVVDRLVIDGLHPGDRPFFTARRIEVSLDWATLLRREVTITDVEMTDWRMRVEKWGDEHNFPKFTSDKPSGPKRFTTTLRHLHAYRGEFIYEDHDTPWSTTARNLDITINDRNGYHGQATFTNGLVRIKDYVPMWANMHCTFSLDGPHLHLDRLDLQSDGADSVVTGDVDFAHWPEQLYQVRSRVRFPRMREIFFGHDRFTVGGDGDFAGTFHLYHGGFQLKGGFTSPSTTVDGLRFDQVRGALLWDPGRFEVSDASSRFYGGSMQFDYGIAPLGSPAPAQAHFTTSYQGVDLAAFTDAVGLRGLRFAGRANGRNTLEWPLDRFSDHRGDGRIDVEAPPGVSTLTPELAAARAAAEDRIGPLPGPYLPQPLPRHLPISGSLTYSLLPDWIDIGASRFATEQTLVTFQGVTAWGEHSRIPFHVTSSDWQESDEVLAGIMTDFGAPTGPVAFGGRGTFDGTFLNAFRDPRVEGTFTGQHLRAWDETWGDGRASIVVENGYVTVTSGAIRLGEATLDTDGRFSLGFPRQDHGEEINARFTVARWPVDALRHAFGIDDYPVDGRLSGEFHLYGAYTSPFGFGRMTIDRGTAYGEPFEHATAGLRFEGRGVRLDGIEVAKGTGAITGAAFVGWNGTYSFNADGRRIPMEQLASVSYPRAPLSGLLEFSAGGSGTFDDPKYDVKGRIDGLFVADEGIGQVTGSLAVRGQGLTMQVEAASPRLAVSGTGTISLKPQGSSELQFRFTDTSLDPYVRLFQPKLSPFTTAVASGTIRVTGRLDDVSHLLVDTTVEQLDLRLFDYKLRNAGLIRLALDKDTLKVQQMQLVGEDTRLTLSGAVDLPNQRLDLRAAGDANLGILQGFFRNVRGSGRAQLTAELHGALAAPALNGRAVVTNGRIRDFALPNSLEAINGTVLFDDRGVVLDGLTAQMGGGPVQFGGRIGLSGYSPGELNVTAHGTDMHLRYPEGFQSVIDADLSLRGRAQSPTLGGTVTVKSAVFSRRFQLTGNLFDLGGSGTPAVPGPPGPELPVHYDVRIEAPSTLRVENNLVRMVARADLTLQGTYSHPLLFGRAEVDRGQVLFEGKNYLITHGTIDFTNPTKIEPFFDVAAETRVRVPGQTYQVTVQATGTTERLQPELTSDPPLPTADLLALLLGNEIPSQDAELQALQRPNQVQQDLLASRATQLLTGPVASEVGKVVEQTFGVDTFQLTPSLFDPYQTSSRLNPTARLTIGKRLSDRVYITYSRSLSSAINDQIILLEYDQGDRLSWILSQNEDRTYALEVRVRHTF